MPSTEEESPVRKPETDDRHYIHRGGDAAPGHFATRSATRQAGFLLSHLRSGMRLLDCGCGSGSITLGLAEAVAPGQAVGIDLDDEQVGLARNAALKQNAPNARFETASIFELPFPEASFDAVFSNGVLPYLHDPLAALQEMYRVLKPAGVIGIRNGDAGGQFTSPIDHLLSQSLAVYWQLIEHTGGDRYVARRQRALLRRAGFSDIQAGASCETYSTPEATQHWGTAVAAVMGEELADQLIELGLADRDTLNQMSAAWRRWAEDPDAFHTEVWCETVGWIR